MIRTIGELEETLYKEPVCETPDALMRILCEFVSSCLDQGLLFANLRGHSFQADEENAAVYRICMDDGTHQAVAKSLCFGTDVKPESDDAIYAAEMVLNLTLDMAAGMGSYNYSKEERLNAVRKAITSRRSRKPLKIKKALTRAFKSLARA